MTSRTRRILTLLCASLSASLSLAVLKMVYGSKSHSTAFFADGIHSLFDSLSTLLGIFSITASAKPPDAGHPYGHRKMETVAAMLLSVFLLFAAYELGTRAYLSLSEPLNFPQFSAGALVILGMAIVFNLTLGFIESREASSLGSSFLKADSLHNISDFLTGVAVLSSVISARYRIPYGDAVATLVITVYLVFLSIRLILSSVRPLVDASVLDPERVAEIVCGVQGVIHCHHIRSRGEQNYHFLDLNIHLPGDMPLQKAHEITHEVESRLKASFPGLMDVVIHTEPHDHPPC